LKKDKPLASNRIGDPFVKGTIIAIIITIPSLIAFFVSWNLLNDIITAAIIGTVIHFIGLVSSLKFSKKIFK